MVLTDLGELHQLLRRRHHVGGLHLIDEGVGDVGVAVVEQLADDQLVQVLPVLQRGLGSVHGAVDTVLGHRSTAPLGHHRGAHTGRGVNI